MREVFFLLDGLFIEEFKKYFLRSHLLLRILKLRFFYAGSGGSVSVIICMDQAPGLFINEQKNEEMS
jgi:hypothetical protein